LEAVYSELDYGKSWIRVPCSEIGFGGSEIRGRLSSLVNRGLATIPQAVFLTSARDSPISPVLLRTIRVIDIWIFSTYSKYTNMKLPTVEKKCCLRS
jgi:hypothetical protein